MASGVDRVDGLRILFVEAEHHHVVVDVYGSDPAVCSTIRFRFDRRRDRTSARRRLMSWRDDATVLTYLGRSGLVTLLPTSDAVDAVPRTLGEIDTAR